MDADDAQDAKEDQDASLGTNEDKIPVHFWLILYQREKFGSRSTAHPMIRILRCFEPEVIQLCPEKRSLEAPINLVISGQGDESLWKVLLP